METIVVAFEESVLPNPENTLEQVTITEQEVVVVNTETSGIVVTGIMGPPGTTTISGLTDIDRTDLTDGATLVYKASNAVWKATNKLDNQILEAGQF